MRKILALGGFLGILICAAPAQADPKPAPTAVLGGAAPAALPQSGTACGSTDPNAHCTTLSWTASTSAATCSSTGTPPCTLSYNVFRGTAAGAEGSTPINGAPIAGTAYIDPVTLTSSPQTLYYTVQAVEVSGGVTATSGSSNEASASFPGIPAAPTANAAAAH